MSLNYNKIIVYDYESDNLDPKIANPVEIAAKVYDGRTLEALPDGEFDSGCRPDDIDKEDYLKAHLSTIEWHSKLHNCSVEDIVNKWKTYPAEKIAWEQFINFLAKYNPNTKSKLSAPIRAGWNIVGYDDIITQRLCNKYGNADKEGNQKIFTPRHVIDGLHLCFYWFENLENGPDLYGMDPMREYLGINKDNAHTAIKDVRDSGRIITHFMMLHRKSVPALKVQFKDSAKKWTDL